MVGDAASGNTGPRRLYDVYLSRDANSPADLRHGSSAPTPDDATPRSEASPDQPTVTNLTAEHS